MVPVLTNQIMAELFLAALCLFRSPQRVQTASFALLYLKNIQILAIWQKNIIAHRHKLSLLGEYNEGS